MISIGELILIGITAYIIDLLAIWHIIVQALGEMSGNVSELPSMEDDHY